MKTDSVDWIYNEIHKKMCSTNIDEIIKLPVVNCLTFLWLSTNLWLQSETIYAKLYKSIFKSFNKFAIRKHILKKKISH